MSGTAVVIGAAGGCGATLLAGALAVAAARRGERSMLVELDLVNGDLAGAWELAAARTLADLAPVSAELDAGHLRAAAHPHASGVAVVPAGPGPHAPWSGEAVGRLLALAGAEGRAAVDAGTGPSETALAAAAAADAVLVVCPRSVAGVRRARRLVGALAAAGVERSCALVVAAAPGGRVELSAAAASAAVGVQAVGDLPWRPGEADQLGAGDWPSGRRSRLRDAAERVLEALG